MKCQLWLRVLMLLLSAGAPAQSPFDGTWKIDANAIAPSTAHFDYLLKDGTYRCSTCDPPIVIPADGRDHQITGEPCYETVSVKIVDQFTTEEADKRKGTIVGTTKITVSPDGNTATVDWTETCSANGDIVSGQEVMSRVEKGPAGSHAISGSWKVSKRANLSENALLITLKLAGDTFSFSDPTNQHYSAKLDGTEARFGGDLSGTIVSVKRLGANTIEESDKHDGKITRVARFIVSDDGHTLTIVEENKTNGTSRQWIAHKQ